jgi:PEP-utilising enzyme, mobile domain
MQAASAIVTHRGRGAYHAAIIAGGLAIPGVVPVSRPEQRRAGHSLLRDCPTLALDWARLDLIINRPVGIHDPKSLPEPFKAEVAEASPPIRRRETTSWLAWPSRFDLAAALPRTGDSSAERRKSEEYANLHAGELYEPHQKTP